MAIFGLFIGAKAAGILDGARLATDGISGLDTGGRTLFHSETHTLDDWRIGLFRHFRLPFGQIAPICRVLMNMRDIVPAAIGDRDGEVAELQGRTGDITLPHAGPPDGLAVPAVLVAAVQIVGTR